jgi:GNAT superfamily N-acetyltransferase
VDPELVETMRAAFADDPLYVWLQPEATARPRLLRDVSEFVLAQGFAHGEVHATDARDGVAVWTGPGVDLVADEDAERYLDLLGAHVGEDRMEAVVAGMEAVERHAPGVPHRTLHSVCVHPRAQGRGVGTALVRPVLERCDAERLAAYLDSSCERNLPFYGRLGFEVVAEVSLPDGGPVMRALLRSSSGA